ncbi:MAG: bifunctional folylpolyglutamate synthase/dihydrofolate synthase [Candidatus Symbiothrix sp.]|jgi:dihydrofolate synthase/folylpolyglutamate synthase|nr:bifunctional folylpolyglutamate synthase/dihydrofolate synthase [Candidatus Symbiothrix sp.]
MKYDKTIEYLYNSAPMFQKIGSAAYKEGMENSFLIDEHLGQPHTHYKTIHVAGTNGKGSTSHLLASILQEAGYKVGLYTSPHLLDFRERIKINGEMVSKSFVVDFVALHKDFFEFIRSSFFELTTGMAFAYFAEQQVDVAVIEVGLGGRLDCTNVITPVLSIITNISFDHTNLLGNTLTAIAKEKAGIMKPGVPVLIGEAEGDVKAVFCSCYCGVNLQSTASSLFFSKGVAAYTRNDGEVAGHTLKGTGGRNDGESGCWVFDTPEYPELIGELGGFAQEKNAATVLCAVGLLKETFEIPPKAVYKGFRYVIENTGLMGRWQILQQHPKIVLDTGHNTGGIQYIVQQLKTERYDRLHIVFGMVNDKDISAVLRLLPQDAVYYFTQANIPRALDAWLLAEQAAKFGLTGAVFYTVGEAFLAAKRNASKKDFIFVGGSTFVVAEAMEN